MKNLLAYRGILGMDMAKGRSGLMKGIEVYFMLFILIQPILDLTSYVGLPVSEPVRVLSMLVGVLYILFFIELKEKKMALIYMCILGLFMLLSFSINLVYKNPFSALVELTYIVKTTYVVIMMLVYYFIFQSMTKRMDWTSIVKKYMFWGISIVSAVMVLATLTGTGKRSYGYLEKEGHSGWFFSGNELSAIFAMGFTIMILYFMKSSSLKGKITQLPIIGLTVFSILTVGTKVGLGALLFILAAGSLIALFDLVKYKKWLNVVILPLLLIVTFLAIPYSAVGNNIGLTMDRINQAGENEMGDPANEDKRSEQVKEVLSSRGDYLDTKVNQFQEASWLQKLFGMGRGGNYEVEPKLIEMDFFDWFFNFGLIGLMILVSPIFYFFTQAIWFIIKSRFKLISPEILLVGIAVSLGLGTAALAGHVLSSPASGIYLSILLVYLYRITKYSKHKQDYTM